MRCSQGVLFRCYAIPRLVQAGTFKVQCCFQTCSINVLACLNIKTDLKALAGSFGFPWSGLSALCWLMYLSYIKGKGLLLYEKGKQSENNENWFIACANNGDVTVLLNDFRDQAMQLWASSPWVRLPACIYVAIWQCHIVHVITKHSHQYISDNRLTIMPGFLMLIIHNSSSVPHYC